MKLSILKCSANAIIIRNKIENEEGLKISNRKAKQRLEYKDCHRKIEQKI